MRTDKFLIAAAGVLILWGCNVKDPISQTDHPDKGKITVTTDWSGIGQGIDKPAEYYATYGMEELKATQDEYTFPKLFDPESYTLRFYNKPKGITIDGTTATADYTTVSLGWFFSSKLTETIEADRDYAFTVPMTQQVRQLTLTIEPTGGTSDRIANITATISGVAGNLDIDHDTHGTPTNVNLLFNKITTGKEAEKWSATVRLLGVTGTEQKLTGTITFTNGMPDNIPLESDLTAALANFNTDKKEPLALSGKTIETPTETGFTALITGWTPLSGGTGIAW